MWFFLTPVILVILIIVGYWIADFVDGEGMMGAIAVTIFGTAGAIILMFGVLPGLAGQGAEVRPISAEKHDLQALATDTAVQGESYRGVFLGRGWIDDKQVISYVYETDDGGYVLDRSNAEQSVIYEGEEDQPYVQITKYEIVPNGWFAPFVNGWSVLDEYQFYVPDGSVSDGYVVTP